MQLNKQFIMPMSRFRPWDPPKEFEAGGEGCLICTPQLPCIPIRLLVSRETAESFVITDIQYGKCSQFVTGGILWLQPFVAEVPECEGVFVPLCDELGEPPFCYLPFFRLEVIQPAVDMITQVRNISRKRRIFQGAWIVALANARTRYVQRVVEEIVYD